MTEAREKILLLKYRIPLSDFVWVSVPSRFEGNPWIPSFTGSGLLPYTGESPRCFRTNQPILNARACKPTLG